jgi:hypothetical protein
MGISVPTRRLTAQQAKHAHYEKMSAVAELLVDSIPNGMLDVLSDFSFDVRSNDSIYEMWPTRIEMHEDLCEAWDLAFRLRNVLKKAPLAGFLATNSKYGTEERVTALCEDLFEFSLNAAEARRSPALVGEDGQLLSGAGKPLLPGDMPPKYVCAAIIAEVISFLVERGVPTPSQTNAQMAAHLYWTAWPRGPKKRKGWGSHPQKGWGRYFDAADDERLSPLRQEVRRHLSIRLREGI